MSVQVLSGEELDGFHEIDPEIGSGQTEDLEATALTTDLIEAALLNGVAKAVVLVEGTTPSEERPSSPSPEVHHPAKKTPRPTDSHGSDATGQYLSEIGLVPLLTADEEVELSQIIEKGRDAAIQLDTEGQAIPLRQQRELRGEVRDATQAKDRFVRANLRLVVSIARRYPLPPSMELLDLIQEGNLGLEHAVDKFDWRKGYKFSTYATFWIRKYVGLGLDKKASLIGIPPGHAAALRASLRQAAKDGEELDADSEYWYRLTTPTSLDKPVSDEDDGSTLGELLDGRKLRPDERGTAEAAIHHIETTTGTQTLTRLLEHLSPLERDVITARYLEDPHEVRSFPLVAERLDISGDGAQKIAKRACKKMGDAAELLGIESPFTE